MGTQPLEGRVAVVAGATRGAGRGIARMLGEAGAVVYCSGRSVRASSASVSDSAIDLEDSECTSSGHDRRRAGLTAPPSRRRHPVLAAERAVEG